MIQGLKVLGADVSVGVLKDVIGPEREVSIEVVEALGRNSLHSFVVVQSIMVVQVSSLPSLHSMLVAQRVVGIQEVTPIVTVVDNVELTVRDVSKLIEGMTVLEIEAVIEVIGFDLDNELGTARELEFDNVLRFGIVLEAGKVVDVAMGLEIDDVLEVVIGWQCIVKHISVVEQESRSFGLQDTLLEQVIEGLHAEM